MDPWLPTFAPSPARRPRHTTIASAQGPPQAAPPPTQSDRRQIHAAAALSAGSKPDRAPRLVCLVSLEMLAMPPNLDSVAKWERYSLDLLLPTGTAAQRSVVSPDRCYSEIVS